MPGEEKKGKMIFTHDKHNRKESDKRYREKHREILRGKGRQYCKDNRDQMRERSRQYYKDNKAKKKQYYEEHRERIRETKKQWYRDNRNRIKKQQIQNREHINRRQINRYRTDLKFNLNNRMSRAMAKALKGNKSGRHWETLVGYTLEDLIKRLKQTMPVGYDWQDYLEGKLHIDHRIPKSAYNYTKPEDYDFQKCWALSNLQLLSAEENLKKAKRLKEGGKEDGLRR